MTLQQEDQNLHEISRIGLGGSCHWCTEAIFLSLKGVTSVQQGWIAAQDEPERFSEAVLVEFDATEITLKQLIAVHLHTHSCTARHSMREKYRSAVYVFNPAQMEDSAAILQDLQGDFLDPVITEVLRFDGFKLNKPEYLNYYYTDPEKPFCQNIVNPKLRLLLSDFKKEVDADKLAHLLKED